MTPLWPEANGEAERFGKTFKKVLHTTTDWQKEMHTFLRNYRITPHSTTNVPPATALFGRPIRAKFPVSEVSQPKFDPEQMRTRDEKQKQQIKANADRKRKARDSDIKIGDSVLVKQKKTHKLSTAYAPVLIKVIDKKYSLITARGSNGTITRNSSFFKRLHPDLDERKFEKLKAKEGRDDENMKVKQARKVPERLIEQC